MSALANQKELKQSRNLKPLLTALKVEYSVTGATFSLCFLMSDLSLCYSGNFKKLKLNYNKERKTL